MTLQDIKQIDQLFKKHLIGFAKKGDLKDFAKKQDLKSFATKGDLKGEFSRYPSREELIQELSKFATKEDLKVLKNDLETTIGDVGREVLEAIETRIINTAIIFDLRTFTKEHMIPNTVAMPNTNNPSQPVITNTKLTTIRMIIILNFA